MAHTAFDATTPSMRGVRDKYLDLLLTGGSSVSPIAAITPAPATTWTPGQHFTPHAAPRWPPQPPPPPPTWATPVTPGPTEGDVRLAEIAAGLVAAGGVEHRQTETIRRLATQLERSERKLRSLDGKKRRARTSLHDQFDDNPRVKTSARNDTRRQIRFTPGKESRDGGRRAPNPSPRKPSREVYEELERLRREREEWIIGKQRSESEARSLSRMLSDIKNNTSRLLSEREDHIKVINRLQEEVGGLRRRESRRQSREVAMPERAHSQRSASPVPLFSHRSSSANCSPPNLYEGVRDVSPASVRDQIFERAVDAMRAPNPSAGQDPERRSAQYDSAALRQSSEREQELREELQLVLEENAKLSGRIPELEVVCLDLSTRLHQAEARSQNESPANAAPSHGTSKSVAGELVQLIEELEVLEGVSEAINFGMSPSEVDQLQETMSNLELTVENVQTQTASGEESVASAPGEIIKSVVTRLVQIRARLSFRYGKWLKAVGDDDITSLGTEYNGSAGVGSNQTRSVDETMDTQAIDRIIGME